MKKRLSIRQAYEASRCRRERNRRTQLTPRCITCWKSNQQPTKVRSIEIDARGGRLVLPWKVAPGDTVYVSLGNNLNQYRTIKARVAWSQPVAFTNGAIAGLAFEEDVCIAA